MRRTCFATVVLSLALTGTSITPAVAHPHIYVDAHAEITFDSAGAIVAVKNIWRFDDAFSAYAKQGLERQKNGRLTEASAAALARVNIHALQQFRYFTHVRIDGKRVPLGEGTEQKLEDDGEHLTLSFVIRPASPVVPGPTGVTFDIYDSEYFAAITFVKDKPVKLIGAPKTCRAQPFTPTGLTPAAAAALARVPASQRTLPADLQSLTGGIENGVVIDCPP